MLVNWSHVLKILKGCKIQSDMMIWWCYIFYYIESNLDNITNHDSPVDWTGLPHSPLLKVEFLGILLAEEKEVQSPFWSSSKYTTIILSKIECILNSDCESMWSRDRDVCVGKSTSGILKFRFLF